MQYGSVPLMTWTARSCRHIVEQGAAAVQVLSGKWAVSSVGSGGDSFNYVGSAPISSLSGLSFSARLFNSVTVPEPATGALVLLGSAVLFSPGRKRSLRHKEQRDFRPSSPLGFQKPVGHPGSASWCSSHTVERQLALDISASF